MKRRKRLRDGSLGELEEVFEGETEQEKIDRLEKESVLLKRQIQTNAEIADFHEELIVELATILYQ